MSNLRVYLNHDAVPPLFDSHSRVLVLGSFPSVKSRSLGFFYAHPSNRFYPVLSGVFQDESPWLLSYPKDMPIAQVIQKRKEFLLSHGLAMYDVLESCVLPPNQSQDAAISDPVPARDVIERILAHCPIRAIVTTGGLAERLFRSNFKDLIRKYPYLPLPSTSALNRMGLSALIERYRAILPYLDASKTPIINTRLAKRK